jgi:hypothetical protein
VRRVRVVPLHKSSPQYVTTEIPREPSAQAQANTNSVNRVGLEGAVHEPQQRRELVEASLIRDEPADHDTTVVRIVKGGKVTEYRVAKSK